MKNFKNKSNFLTLKTVDCESTNHCNYKPHELQPTFSCKPTRSFLAPKAQLTTNTTYSDSYFHYKTITSPIVKQMFIKHYNSEIKLVNKTIYNQSYKKLCPVIKNFNHSNPNFSNAGQLNFNYPKESTNHKVFRDFSKILPKQQNFKADDSILSLKSIKDQYVTIGKKDYAKTTLY